MKQKEFTVKQFAFVYVTLIILALSTWGLAQLDLGAGWVNNVVALAIACTKAGLVVAIFMNLSRGPRLSRLWAAVGLGWLLILGTILVDYWTRPWDTLSHDWTGTEVHQVAGSPAGGGTTPTIYNGRSFPRGR